MDCIRCGKKMRNTIGGCYTCDECGFGINDLVYRGNGGSNTTYIVNSEGLATQSNDKLVFDPLIEPQPIGFDAYKKAFDDVIEKDIKELSEKTNELSISETLIIGVDKYGTDIFSLTVGKLEGLKTSIKKVFYGDEAEALYKTLINK